MYAGAHTTPILYRSAATKLLLATVPGYFLTEKLNN